MTLNSFADILTLTKKRCNISDVTDFDDIVSTAINSSYLELKKKEPTIVTTVVASVNGVAVLPDDMDSIVSITPDLYADEYKLGNNLILKRENDEAFTIKYTVVPDYLGGSDVPEINKKYFYALSTYGCYAYYNYKKKHNEASAYMQEYLGLINKAESDDMLQHEVQNVYTSIVNGVDVWQGF